jgi:hypothetical protein
MYQNQASNADRNSQAATILGLIFITSFAAIAVFVAKVPSSRAVFAGVAVVGAAYSAYISKTFMVQRESALERYDRVSFRIELEDAFLLAERIIQCHVRGYARSGTVMDAHSIRQYQPSTSVEVTK